MTAAGRLGPPLVLLSGVPQVCALLDNSKSLKGTVGLEYIVELVGGSRKEPALAYECVLCATSLTTKGAVVHHVLQNVHKVLYLVSNHWAADRRQEQLTAGSHSDEERTLAKTKNHLSQRTYAHLILCHTRTHTRTRRKSLTQRSKNTFRSRWNLCGRSIT